MTWEQRREEWARTPKARRPKRGCFWCYGYGVERWTSGVRWVCRGRTNESAPCEVCGEK
jgi:hypothetical protein